MKKITAVAAVVLMVGALMTGCKHTDNCQDSALISSVITGKSKPKKTKIVHHYHTVHHHHHHHDCD